MRDVEKDESKTLYDVEQRLRTVFFGCGVATGHQIARRSKAFVLL